MFFYVTVNLSRAWNSKTTQTQTQTHTHICYCYYLLCHVTMSNNDLPKGESASLIRQPLLSSSQRSIVNSTSQVAIVGANVCPIESLDYESVFFFHLGSVFFVQSLNLFVDPFLNCSPFCCGHAGFLRTNSSNRIGEVEGLFRFFSTYVWSGYCVSWLVWLLVLLGFATILLLKILLGSSLLSHLIWCCRGGTVDLFYVPLRFLI